VNVLIIKNLWSLIFGNEKGKGFWAWITELNKHGIANIKDKGKIDTISPNFLSVEYKNIYEDDNI
jgi:hypothetical protein